MTFLPAHFTVPRSFTHKDFTLEVLRPAVAEGDYAAFTNCRKRLRNMFGKNNTWPKDTLTLMESRADLALHEQEFDEGIAFVYTVLSPDKSICLGTVYIDPSPIARYDCMVHIWVSDDYLYLDITVYQVVKAWIENDWPLTTLAFPGREIERDRWEAMLA